MVKTDFSGNYLNADTCKQDDECVIKGEGVMQLKKFGEQLDLPVMNLRTQKELTFSPNQSSGKKLSKAFGEDTKNWVGKQFKVHLVKEKRNGEIKDVVMIEPLTSMPSAPV